MDSMSMEPPPRMARGWWMDEAIAQDPGEPCPPLAAHTAADVVILGGGYTGMWTAYFLKERDPGIDVVLLEQDICGGGPSGRNGGFVNGYWSSIGELAYRFGDGDALELCLAASRSVAEIGRFCQR
ncbi:MAG TPA: FAD-dependent oxidoreductase, partial [Actinomycetota bacterium]